MWMLICAVVTASLLGSMHCVGMCGPLAIWASGLGQRYSRSQVAAASALYHSGRLVTYSLAGLLAGFAGRLADFGGEALGFQLAAARIAGTLMILIGAWRLLNWPNLVGPRFGEKRVASSTIATLLVSLRPYVISLPVSVRALVAGLLTTLLPCGWLYLFALAAAGTGSASMGFSVMVAFWIGTLPALVGLIAASHILVGRLRSGLPTMVAILLIVGGLYTAAGRGFAILRPLAEHRASWATVPAKLADVKALSQQDVEANCIAVAGEIDELTKTPLPCCHEN